MNEIALTHDSNEVASVVNHRYPANPVGQQYLGNFTY
jgi:hypothetical protein